MFARPQSARLHPPGPVLDIVRDLEQAGFEAWCVGGAIRDALLGHDHLDWDLATSATPDQVRSIFGRKRTVPVGIEFGTVGVLDEHGTLHEVTTFRRDVRTDGRHAEVEFGASLDDDLARRDFTINAMAYSPSRKKLHDPFGGGRDLEEGTIRAVGDPGARLREDYLRALRAIRFAARFGFEIEAATWNAVRQSAPHLTRLSAERVKQELEKTMDQVRQPSRALSLWKESGALAVLVPELANVSSLTLAAVDHAAVPGLLRRPGRRLGRLTVLFSELGAGTALHVGTRLRFSKHESQWIDSVVGHWHKLGDAMATSLRSGSPSDAEVRRWVAAIGRTQLAAFFRLAAARWAAAASAPEGERGPAAPTARAVHSLYRRSLKTALRDPVDLRDLAIDGDDLRQVGITPGPGLGKILAALLDLVVTDPSVNVRERLLDEARRLHSTSK